MDKVERINNKRSLFREQYSGVLFNSYLNALLVLLVLLGSLFIAALNIDWKVSTLLYFLVGFVYSDFVFYLTHRYQQHQKIRFSESIFKLHTYWHHGMFSDEKMSVDSLADTNMVILPFAVHGFVLFFIYLPIALLVNWLFNLNLGWVLMFAVATHLLWYELVHTVAHMNNPPILKTLARHHKEHHNHNVMSECNFGIGTTLFDRVFGTCRNKD